MRIGSGDTGDLSALADLIEPHYEIDGNWFKAQMRGTGLTLGIKVFAETSMHGIGGGRISKLSIYDDLVRWEKMDFHAACETHFDRGWDIRPRTREAYERCRAIVEALGGQMDIKPKKRHRGGKS